MADRSKELKAGASKKPRGGYVGFIDTETDMAEGLQSLKLACYEVWETNALGLPISATPTEKKTIYQEAEFYQALKRYPYAEWTAHNWDFDGGVLRVFSSEAQQKYGFTIDATRSILPVNGRMAPFVLRLSFIGSHSVDLTCNTNYYKLPLADIGPSFGKPKNEDEIDLKTATMKEIETYCARDVEILRMAWFKLFEITQELGGCTPGPTIASTAFRIWKNKFFPADDITIRGNIQVPRVNAAEAEAYRGGHTDCYFKGSPKVDRIYKFDVNSQYPSQMLGEIPVEFQREVALKRFDLKSGVHLARVKLNIPEESFIGLAGIVDEEGKFIFPAGTFTTWLWQPELEIADELGYIVEYEEVFKYKTAPIFKGFVEKVYALRRHYKETEDEALSLVCKIILNSLYGKFGQKENPEVVIVEPETEEYEIVYERDYHYRRFEEFGFEYLQLAGTLYRFDIPEQNEYSEYAVLSIAGLYH